MKILHVLDHSLPQHSGYAFRTESIIREQARLGWSTYHLTTPKHGQGPQLFEDVEGLRFYRTPSDRPVPLLRQMGLTRARLLQLCQELKPDVIHAHSPVLNVIPALMVRRQLGIPVVYEMRATWEDAAVDQGTTTEGSLRYRLSRMLDTWSLRRADQVTTICEGLRGEILKRGVDQRKVTVIPNAVDTEGLRFGIAADPALQAKYGLVGKTTLGFIGSFYRYEGLHLLVEAMQELSRSLPDVRLLLVGGGEQEQALKEQVRQAGLSDRVIFAGRVPHDEIEPLYALVDILVYPRTPIRLTELVTPLKPLEAMAQGKLLIASDVGGHRELIRDGDTGTLFAAGDVPALCKAVRGLVEQRTGWDQMRHRARQFVERERTWTLSVSHYRQVYGAALNRALAGA